MDRSLPIGGIVTAIIAFIAWTQLGRPAIAPVGLVAGLFVGLATEGSETGFLDGAKAGTLGGVLFVLTVAGLGAYRYRLIGVGFAIDWALFTTFSMLIIVLPLFAMEGAIAAPATAWTRRSLGKFFRNARPE